MFEVMLCVFLAYGALGAIVSFLENHWNDDLQRYAPIIGLASEGLLVYVAVVTGWWVFYALAVLLIAIWIAAISSRWFDFEIDVFGDLLPFIGWNVYPARDGHPLLVGDIEESDFNETVSVFEIEWLFFHWAKWPKEPICD